MRKLVGVIFAFSSTLLMAQSADVPLQNWTVPPYTLPTGSVRTMTDIAGPRAFVPIQPCRVVDTRGGGVFTGAYGPPIMAANAVRAFDINSAPHCPGIPSTATAYSLNFTVTQTAGAAGDIRVWPTGNPPMQVTSVLNWTVVNATIANATVMPAGTGGSIDVQVAGSNTHLLIDINGYFSESFDNTGSYFLVTNNLVATAAIKGVTLNPGGYGVWGDNASGSGIGVLGTSLNGNGVWGQSATQDGMAAFGGRDGGYLQGNRHGVIGASVATSGATYGVLGATGSSAADSAGVRGTTGPAVPGISGFTSCGVRGEGGGSSNGVFGLAGVNGIGVIGRRNDSGGNAINYGDLAAGGYGVYAGGDYGGTGAKYFVEPHPTDPSKLIKYIALEGGEPGTYFRGRGRFQNGTARIPVPEDFRIVTDPEGLSVQITPIGAMATVAVMRADLDAIVVQSSRNVEFYYTVNGIRRTHKHLVNPIVDASEEYMPESAQARMPLYLTPLQREWLIRNGTYRPDGAVNLETAHRLGWDRIWEERARPSPVAQPD